MTRLRLLILISLAIQPGTDVALYNGMLYDRTRSQAFTDSLTGVFNILYITEQVEDKCRMAATRRDNLSAAQVWDIPGAPIPAMMPDLQLSGEDTAVYGPDDAFALLCMDLDSFKPINDNFGHQKGDEVLRDVAQIFRNEVEGRGMVGRYGGDEFLIILNSGDACEAEALSAAPATADWRGVGEVEHGFTHFTLTLQLLRAEGQAEDVIWTPRRGLDALPSVFLKAVRAGLSNLL